MSKAKFLAALAGLSLIMSFNQPTQMLQAQSLPRNVAPVVSPIPSAESGPQISPAPGSDSKPPEAGYVPGNSAKNPSTAAETQKKKNVPLAWPGPRTEAPDFDNPYYFDDNPYYQMGYGMPNCTCYAFGRAYELLGELPKLTEGNADDFWPDNLSSGAYPYGSEPKLGAVVCWDEGWYGHVAVVEAIEGERILVSESNWGGRMFYMRWVDKQSEDLQGYIYIADFKAPSAAETRPPSEPLIDGAGLRAESEQLLEH